MKEMLKLLNNYLVIINSSVEIWLVFSSLDEDVSIKDSDLFEYYSDFKHIDLEHISTHLINACLPSDKIERLINALKILKETYIKYGVNNLDELSSKILNEWNNSKDYSDELIKDILLIECRSGWDKLPKSNTSLLKIYKDMVDGDMIVNPNIPVGTSSERLYTMLPDDASCYRYNLKVISNPMIDWSIYRNGRNPLEQYCALYNNSKNEEERKYYHDLIITAIFSSCSLFNNKFAWHTKAHKTEEMINYYLLVEKNEINSRHHSLNDISFISEIHELLLNDELFNHQLELYTEKNDDAEEVIKELKLSRESVQHKVYL
ncbi:MAG: hypothetical protein E7158_00360 [Firmicutes bacterium]|nr:hypothetical protein [Bacillota bacterium]